jgi:alpha-glucuronidase
MNPKQACLYDNPETWQRELWHDGKIVRVIDSQVLLSRDFIPDYMPSIGLAFKWSPGQIHYGSKDAMQIQEVTV